MRVHLRTAILVPFGWALLALGCGSESATDEAPGSSVRLEVRWSVTRTGESAGEAPPRSVWRRAASDWRQWGLDGGRIEFLEADERHPERLLFEGEGTRAISIRDHFEPATFDRLRLRATLTGAEIAAFSFRREGQEVLALNGRQLLHTRTEHEVDLVGLREHDEAFDELLIVFAGAAHQMAVEEIELLDCPARSWLPAADDARWTELGTDARPAWSLLAGERLRLDAERPSHANALELAIGLPPLVAASGRRARLHLRGDGLDETREVELDSARGRWWVERIPLSGDRTAPTSLEIECPGEPSAELGLAVARPRFVRLRDEARTVLLFTSDTHRADYLGAARRGVEVDTPTLDTLAARGLMFENAQSVSNITVPSHVSLLTALPPQSTRVVGNLDSIGEDAQSLAESFRASGFTCVAATSTVLLDPTTSGLGQGFQRFSAPLTGQRDSRQTIARLLEWLPELDGEDLFIWLHVYDAHTSYEPPRRHRRYYPEDRDPRDPTLPPPAEHARAYWMLDVRDPHYIESLYRSEVSYLDMRLGEVLAQPRFANAIIAATADHGESLGNHDVWYAHHLLYPDTLDVPLILAWPGAPAGTRIERPVSNTDIGRTLLDLAGLGDTAFPGRNLTEWVEREREGGADEQPLFAVADDYGSASIRLADWFLVLHFADQRGRPGASARERHQVELYDLLTDRRCQRNQVEIETDRAARLRALLIRELESRAETALARERTIDDRLKAEVEALGYVGGQAHGEGRLIDPECGCEWCERLRR